MPPYAYINPFPIVHLTDDTQEARDRKKLLIHLVLLFFVISFASMIGYLFSFKNPGNAPIAALVIMSFFTAVTVLSFILWIYLHIKTIKNRKKAVRNEVAAVDPVIRDSEGQAIELQSLETNRPSNRRNAASAKRATPDAPERAHVARNTRYVPPTVEDEEKLQTILIE